MVVKDMNYILKWHLDMINFVVKNRPRSLSLTQTGEGEMIYGDKRCILLAI